MLASGLKDTLSKRNFFGYKEYEIMNGKWDKAQGSDGFIMAFYSFIIGVGDRLKRMS